MNNRLNVRVWDKTEKKMTYLNIMRFLRYSNSVTLVLDNVADPYIDDYFDDSIQNDFIVMLPTGLKDKNGKEICEGDIYHQGDRRILYVVIYEDAQFIGNQVGNRSLAGLSHFLPDIEVIGNIYETPELTSQAAT